MASIPCWLRTPFRGLPLDTTSGSFVLVDPCCNPKVYSMS